MPIGLRLSRSDLGRLIAWLVIVAPAIIDWFHGYLAAEYGITALAAAYRVAVLVLGVAALLTRPRASLVAAVILYLAFMVFEFLIWAAYSEVFFAAELESFANVLLLPLCYALLTFTTRYMGVSHETLITQVVAYGRIAAAVVIVSLLLDVGEPTHLTRGGAIYGFGTQSYYVAGNVLGLTLIVALAVAVIRFVRDCQPRRFLDALLIATGAFSVGSRTGMLLSFALLGSGILYFVFLGRGQAVRRAVLAIVFLPVLVIGVVKAYDLVSQYPKMISRIESLVAGEVRDTHTDAGWEFLSSKRAPARLAGSSFQAYIKEFAQYTPKKGVQWATTESDPVDALAAYGFVGIFALYLPYALAFAMAALNYFSTRHTVCLVALVGLSLLLGHSILAGHVLFDSKATQFATIFIVLALDGGRSAPQSSRMPKSRSSVRRSSR